MNRNREAKSLTFWRGSEDSQVLFPGRDDGITVCYEPQSPV